MLFTITILNLLISITYEALVSTHGHGDVSSPIFGFQRRKPRTGPPRVEFGTARTQDGSTMAWCGSYPCENCIPSSQIDLVSKVGQRFFLRGTSFMDTVHTDNLDLIRHIQKWVGATRNKAPRRNSAGSGLHMDYIWLYHCISLSACWTCSVESYVIHDWSDPGTQQWGLSVVEVADSGRRDFGSFESY